jgi:hypothetical protein
MAYSTTNPPVPAMGSLTRASTGDNLWPAPQLWLYRSTHRTSEFDDTGFFSNGFSLGMRVGDLMLASHVSSHGSTVIAVSLALVSGISTAGAVTVIGSTVVSST